MGGSHFVYTRLHTDSVQDAATDGFKNTRPLLGKKTLEAGFEFIKQEAPRTNTEECEQILWKEVQLNDPSSPIFHFREKTIDAVLAQIRKGSDLVIGGAYDPG
jgi:hypothetical protein